ncbi:hypothetical protein DVH24_035262 [Malus domestica]|uniref:Uncharacterized protein n=1 Tax=Malus domestica TaxID=3750 RepID=A0A498J4F4_MALDO|nr:hypothetical protein DVH24_035262 [Malus domestica]
MAAAMQDSSNVSEAYPMKGYFEILMMSSLLVNLEKRKTSSFLILYVGTSIVPYQPKRKKESGLNRNTWVGPVWPCAMKVVVDATKELLSKAIL